MKRFDYFEKLSLVARWFCLIAWPQALILL